MIESKSENLTSGKKLAHNVVYSLIGQGIPLVAAIFTIPLLIQGFGTERFGILTISWMIVSYFSLFDLGLGRSLTQLISEKLGEGKDSKEIAELIWTALFLMMLLGIIGMVAFLVLTPWIVYVGLKIPLELQEESLHIFYFLSISVPIITVSAGLVGVLSSFQRFDVINIVRIPLGLLMSLSPLLILPFSHSLLPVIISLIIGRVVSCIIYFLQCFRVVPSLGTCIRIRRNMITPLMKFGGWMTLSNIISPLMVSMDRLLIGGLISVSAIAYYTTPYEIATKLWLIPNALVIVLFPAFSTSFVRDKERSTKLFNQGIKYIFLLLFPLTLIIVMFSSEIFRQWLGEEFSVKSALVLQLLVTGVMINSFSQVPFALIQGLGRPDITAKFHFFELPFYLVLLWQLTYYFGITGSALAWVVRVIIDTGLLFYTARKLLPSISYYQIKYLTCMTISLAILMFFIFFKLELQFRLILFLFIVLIFLVISWINILDSKEREIIKARIVKIKH